MTDTELTEWEHQSHVITVLTSREMGAWLGRRDSRLLQEIRQEIDKWHHLTDKAFNDGIDTALEIIDKHIKVIEGEDIGDYPNEIPNQFDNMTGSMNL